MKKLGVIGGLGPIATAYFLELVIKMTDVSCDQEHLEMIIYNKPSTPDRTSYIIGKSTVSPLKSLQEVGNQLELQGVDYIAIPCITAHYFYEQLEKGIHVPIIHIIKETVKQLKESGIKKVGIMATDGTIESGLFQKELEENGLVAIVPDKKEQSYIMNIIYQDVKANRPPEMDKFEAASRSLREKGAEVIILGCTELSLIKRDYQIGPGYIDAMEVLAMKSVTMGEVPLKEEYTNLITT